MTCDEAQRLSSAVLDREIVSSRSHAAMEAHLAECGSCRRFVELSLRVGEGYRAEVESRIDAYRRLEPRRAPPRLPLAAALLLLAILGGVLTGRPPRETSTPAKGTLAAAPAVSPIVPRRRPLPILEELDLPRTLGSERRIPQAPEFETPLEDWMRTLPASLADEVPSFSLPALPARFAEES